MLLIIIISIMVYIYYDGCFIFVLYIVRCCLCLYFVLFL
jgi:hypothetical protein